jgi:hypothetical protein
MHTSCPFGGTCWFSCLALCGGWLLLTSGLLFFTWNKVVCTVVSMKKVKYWQALLALATVCVLVMPLKRGRGHHARHHSGSECCDSGCETKGECAYEKPQAKNDKAEAKKK